MASYLDRIEQAAPAARWPMVRQWMEQEPLPLFAELREYRPVLELPELSFVTRFEDCITVLRQPEVFTVALYQPKQGGYWMSHDETARHWREKSIMRSVLDLEELANVRRFIGERTVSLLQAAGGGIDAVNGLCRAIPIALVRERFGFTESDPEQLREWSYWNQYDAFHNQPFDADRVRDSARIVARREAANAQMVAYLLPLVQRRVALIMSGQSPHDSVTRLVRIALSGAVQFDLPRIAQNVGGLLIGTVETTSHAAINALEELLRRVDVLPQAIAAAEGPDPTEFDGYVWEALRFNPPFPYFFRKCAKRARLAYGTTTVEPGTIVLPCVHAAMFDPSVFERAADFDPARGTENTFHFGYGHHECLGRHVARQMVPEIVRNVLRMPGIQAAGPVEKRGGPFPESFPLRWNAG